METPSPSMHKHSEQGLLLNNYMGRLFNIVGRLLKRLMPMFTGLLKESKLETASGTWMLIGTDANTLAVDVAGLMEVQNYGLESGTPLAGVYGTGKAVGWLLWGGLSNRYKYNISVSDVGSGEVVLALKSAMRGWTGGVMGALKLKKETKRLIALIDHSIAKA